jgi:hypothetical protein
MTPANEQELWRQAHDEARNWVRRKRILFTMLGVYAALSVMWLLIDLADDSSGYWFYWPMLGTGIGVAIAAVVLLGVGGVFGADWEQREIDRYMARRAGHRPGPPVRDDDVADTPPDS